MKPTLRPATPADIAAVTAIYRPAVLTGTASFELEPPGEDEMLRRFRAITEAGYPYVVAELGRSRRRLCLCQRLSHSAGYRFTVENSVYIAPDVQGKGIGRALLDRLIPPAATTAYRLMIAVIGDSANFASISLHRRAGFRFCGTIHSVGFKFGRWLDSVIMELPLGEGIRRLQPKGRRAVVALRSAVMTRFTLESSRGFHCGIWLNSARRVSRCSNLDCNTGWNLSAAWQFYDFSRTQEQRHGPRPSPPK
jgi:phosphinothricin acetyltransferase